MSAADTETVPFTGAGAAYWERIAGGRFSLPSCTSCSHRFLPPRLYCPACGSETLGWYDSDGAGELYAFSVVEKAPNRHHSAAVPYAIGLATLDDLPAGSRFYARIAGVDPAQLHSGMRMRVQIRELAPGQGPLPVLVPAEGA